MKKVLIHLISLCAFCVFTMRGFAVEVDFRSSYDKVEGQLYRAIPLGTAKSDVIRIMKSEIGLPEPPMISHLSGMRWVHTTRAGESLEYYSSVKMHVLKHRSLKAFFQWVFVDVLFFFDEGDKLVLIEVRKGMDLL